MGRVDADAIAKEYNVQAAIKPGPRLSCLDWLEGRERSGARLRGPQGALGDVVGHHRTHAAPRGVLEADLVLTPDSGDARITQDDFGNVYDRAGGPFSNYRP